MNRSIWLVILLIALVACSSPTLPPSQPAPTATKPEVIIASPASGAQVSAGADVVIQSTSSDAQGILRVELLVDGQSVRSDPIPTGKSQPQFQIAQTWKATTAGTHIVIVRATNQAGATGEAALSLSVSEPPKPTNTPVPTAAPTTPPAAPTATSAPAPDRTLTPTTAPTVLQYTFTLNEEQFNAVANEAMSPGVIWYADNASVKLQNGQVAISANYYPPNIKPSIANVVLTVGASNCNIRVSIVGATLGYSTLPEYQKALLAQSIERLLARQVAQQRAYTCVDSITIGAGVMTIKYH
jgi:hypothetical protein